MQQRIFSGVQPTGKLHIGGYLGAFRNWVKLQDTFDTIYCIVDLHAMTVDYNPNDLEKSRIDTAKVLLALGRQSPKADAACVMAIISACAVGSCKSST